MDFNMEREMTDSALSRQEGGGHYKDMKIQPVEFIHANGLGFLEGCVVKRICRWRNKNGIQDLLKIKHEIDLLIELEQRNPHGQFSLVLPGVSVVSGVSGYPTIPFTNTSGIK